MTISKDRISALVFLALSIFYGYHATQIAMFPGDEYEPFTARTVPYLLSGAGVLLSLLLLVTGKPEAPTKNVTVLHWGLLFRLVGAMAAYGFLLPIIGFLLSTSFFLFAGFWLLGERNKKILFGASFPFVFAFWLLLTKGLDIYLAPGSIFAGW